MVKCKKACPTNFPSVNLRNTKFTEIRKGVSQESKKSTNVNTAESKTSSVTVKPAQSGFKIDIILS